MNNVGHDAHIQFTCVSTLDVPAYVFGFVVWKCVSLMYFVSRAMTSSEHPARPQDQGRRTREQTRRYELSSGLVSESEQIGQPATGRGQCASAKALLGDSVVGKRLTGTASPMVARTGS